MARKKHHETKLNDGIEYLDDSNEMESSSSQVDEFDEFDEFDYLIVRESFCMACDTPLKSYHSLICHDCLSDGAELFHNLINKNIKNSIFIDPNFVMDISEDIIEEEIHEDEDEDEDEIEPEDEKK